MSLSPIPDSPPLRNELLAALPPEDVEHLRPHLRRAILVRNQVLYEQGGPTDEVYFIQEGVVSLTADTGDNGSVEVGMTGRDGLAGASALLDPDAVSSYRATVQVPGHAVRMQTAAFREAVERLPALRDRCLRYLQVTLIHASQGMACNTRHELPERLARWLLLAHDRLDSDDLPLKQEFLSQMLGVRRAGVSVVATALQSQGLIRQTRGCITVLDRAGLEEAACNCYRFIKDSSDRIMSRGK